MSCGPTGVIRFFVRGKPVTQGSKTAYVVGGRAVVTSASKGLAAWRRLVADQAQPHAPPMPWDRPVTLHATFYIPRPRSEPKRRRTWPDRKPDASKLLRAVEDALTRVFWADDARIVVERVEKRWADDPFELPAERRPPGVLIEAWPVEDATFGGHR